MSSIKAGKSERVGAWWSLNISWSLHFLRVPRANVESWIAVVCCRWTKPCSRGPPWQLGELHLPVSTCSIRCYCCRPSVLQGGASDSPRRGEWRAEGWGPWGRQPTICWLRHIMNLAKSLNVWILTCLAYQDNGNDEKTILGPVRSFISDTL